jgi:hypothetical protein
MKNSHQFGNLLAIFVCLLISTAIAYPAGAQTGDYREEYKLFNQALQAGDLQAAAAHGRAAWQAAETALGDDPLTGVLAYNYGQLVLYSDTEDAVVALRRANQLFEAGIVELPAAELRLYLAYAEFQANERRRRYADDLRDALLSLEPLGFQPSLDTASMWLQLATADMGNEEYEDAIASSSKAETQFRTVAPEENRRIAAAILISGISQLVPYPREIEDIEAAHNKFISGRQLFSAQRDIESFDDLFAELLAWDAAADAAVHSIDLDHYPGHKGKSEAEFHGEIPLMLESGAELENCGVEWKKRPRPRYPNSASYRGYIGAVLIAYDLGDDLKVHNPRIIAEVPKDEFSDNTLRAIRNWELAAPPKDDIACRTNLITQMTFVIKE